MPVINASAGDLTDVKSILRWFTDELITNHRFTARFGDVNGSAVWTGTDIRRWLDRPQSETFYNQYDMTFGIQESGDSRGSDLTPLSLGLQVSHTLFSTLDPGSGNRWTDTTWTQNANVLQNFPPDQTTSGATFGGSPCGVDNLEGTSFISARIITSPTSTSATPSEPLYFYCVVEYETGKFRKFGFGEILKYYDWTGGLFVMGDIYSITSGTFYNQERALFGSGIPNESAFLYSRDEASGHIYAPGWTGVADTNLAGGRGWMVFQAIDSANQRCWPCMGWDARNALIYFQQSPSSFSLQSERLPAIIFGANQQRYDLVGFEIHPIGVIPDVFQAVITDFDAYGVFQDSAGDKFMVVPHISKLVSETTSSLFGSGRHGILIKNPDLTVTIT